MTDLYKKLLLKAGKQLVVLNSPPEFVFEEIEGIKITEKEKSDIVILFVYSRNDLEASVHQAISLLKDNSSIFWIAYPKLSGKLKTDLSRDKGWDAIYSLGYEFVTLISMDSNWSAGRLKFGIPKREIIKKKPEEKIVVIPEDFQNLLNQNPLAKSVFDKFAYTHRKEYIVWIESAKKVETRQSRLQKAIAKLEEGKKVVE